MYLGPVICELDVVEAKRGARPLLDRTADWMKRRLRIGTVEVSEPVSGWRVWEVVHRTGADVWLRSVTMCAVWKSRLWRDASPPRREGKTGVHLFKTRDDAVRLATGPWAVMQSHCDRGPFVAGRCRAFGHIVEHKLGYRAQGVMIERLEFLPDSAGQGRQILAAAALESSFGCEVTVYCPRVGQGVAGWRPRLRRGRDGRASSAPAPSGLTGDS